MNIRLADIDDLPAITEIYNQAIAEGGITADRVPFQPEQRTEWFESHSREKYPIFIAEKSGKIIGYLYLTAYRPGREALRFTAEVSFYIHYDHHRQGVASALLGDIIKRCPELEIKNLFAILADNNPGSQQILEKFGFERWAHLPNIADFDGVEQGQYYYGLRVY